MQNSAMPKIRITEIFVCIVSDMLVAGDKGSTVSAKPTVNTVMPTSVVATSSKPDLGNPLECSGRNYATHERDCNKYYNCQYGELIEQR